MYRPQPLAGAFGADQAAKRGLLKHGFAGQITVQRLASEPVDDEFFRQEHLITYETSKGPFSIITVNDASFAECSMADVQVYIIHQTL